MFLAQSIRNAGVAVRFDFRARCKEQASAGKGRPQYEQSTSVLCMIPYGHGYVVWGPN